MSKFVQQKMVRSGGCVQELTNEPRVTVLPRYISPDQGAPIVSDAELASAIPVIDIQSLFSEELEDSELVKLHFACKEWGFFQLVNHGVNLSFLDKVKNEIQEFFNLSMAEKKKYCQYPGELEGFGQVHVVSEEQKLHLGDFLFMMTQPVDLRKPHLFPKLPLPLRDNLEVYSLELKSLAMALLSKMTKVLNIKAEETREFFENGHQSMTMNYYFPCPQAEKVIGLTPHTDASALTILLQINEVDGLQIKKDDEWILIKPLPGAFVVNVGNMLEVITNGAYHSIEHRATVNAEQQRLSIATFCNVRYDGEVGPAKSLISEQTPALFKSVTVEEFFKGMFARELHEKSNIDFMRVHGTQGHD